jgi:two-component system chemotaxis response regulator CheY
MKTVMVVDDSSALRSQVKNYFDLLGFNVIQATDGEDALEKLKNSPEISLFMVDVNMPKINGLKFCELLKEKKIYSKSVIFMLTTESSIELIDRARPLGVKAWILKPFEPGPLSKALDLFGLNNGQNI